MIKITNYSKSDFYPGKVKGLEELVLFPNGDPKYRWGKTIPNSSIWVFESATHKYQDWILADDVGCGMAAFMMKKINHKEAAEKIAAELYGKKVIGHGNHFIDICSGLKSVDHRTIAPYLYNIMILHCDGKTLGHSQPKTIAEAKEQIEQAAKFRENLGKRLGNILNEQVYKLGDWPHNTIEFENGKVIYRKGCIKAKPNDVNILPKSLGSNIMFYTVETKNTLPYGTMPHGTGRKGPKGDLKVDISAAEDIKKLVYVPSMIKPSSLKAEHPDCYNSGAEIFDKLRGNIYSLGEIKILSYIGKL